MDVERRFGIGGVFGGDLGKKSKWIRASVLLVFLY